MGDGKGNIPTARTSGGSPRRSKKRNRVDQLATLGKIQQAVELRKRGASYLQIGSELKCSTTYAHKLVARGIGILADKTGESAKTVKALIVSRMDAMTLKLFTMLEGQFKGPDGIPVKPDIRTALSIIDHIGRLDDRRARLEGLFDGPTVNAPVQVNVDMRRQVAARMAPILANLTLDQKREMLRLIELGEKPPPVLIEAKSAV